jgi:superfamily I DNA/RNA helicase
MQNLTLTGEQKRVLTLPVQHPVLIKGAAGSGKTTVAIFRARHLMETDRDLFRATRVAVVSYTNALVNYVRELLARDLCDVRTLHSFAGCLLFRAGVQVAIEQQTGVLADHVRAALDALRRRETAERAILSKPIDFYIEEIAWIKGRRIGDRDTYLATARTGRGTADRVTAQDKTLLWDIFAAYQSRLAASGRIDWDDLILRALTLAERPGFVPPFSHIVVDEAQDLTYAQLSLIARMVVPETDSITLVADSAQRIYQSGFSWAGTGLNIRGRSVEFRHNYRNTRQIAETACSLLSRETDRTDFTDPVLPEREGPLPRLVHAGSHTRQVEWIAAAVRAWGAAGDGSVAIATPKKSGARHLAATLNATGIATRDLRSREPVSIGVPVVDTLYAIKGIEFDHVILCDLNEDLLPTAAADDPDACSRLRKLLYVGMTRARQTLSLVTSGRPARLLDEIDVHTLQPEAATHV